MDATEGVRDKAQIERDVREGRDPVLARARAMAAYEAGRDAFERGDWPTMHAMVHEEQYWKARYPQPPIEATCYGDADRVLIGGGQAVMPSDGRFVSSIEAA